MKETQIKCFQLEMQDSEWQWKMSAMEDNLSLYSFGNITTLLHFFAVIFIYWCCSTLFSLVRAEDTQDWQETFIKVWRMLPGEGFLWQRGFPTVPNHKSSLWGKRLDLITSGRLFATAFPTAALILSCPGAFKFSLGAVLSLPWHTGWFTPLPVTNQG